MTSQAGLFLLVLVSVAAGGCVLQGFTLPSGQFTIVNQQNQDVFTFSLCKPVAASVCGSGAGVCQNYGSRNASVVAGQYGSRKASGGPQGLTIVYSNGTACAGGQARQTTVTIACDASVAGVVVDSVAEQPVCVYSIAARSSSVCGGSAAGGGGGACAYSVGAESYDLRSVPVIESPPHDVSGAVFQLSLCAPLACGGSFICQTTAGRTHGLGALRGVAAATKHGATLAYAAGTPCSSGPRSAAVTVLCGQQHRFLNVTEAPACSYSFFVSSPSACPSHRR